MSFTPEHLFTFSPGNNYINEVAVNEFLNLSNWDGNSKQKSSIGNTCLVRRKRGRPPAQVNKTDTSVINVPIVSDLPTSDNYSPNHFWCPSCSTTYAASTCPIHKCLAQPDTVISYAHLSLPAGLKLVQKRGRICVILTKRLPVLTKFGPVVAPLITGEELQQNPSWLSDCSFRMDVLSTGNQRESVQYLRLNDESQCNWMMFVQRRECCTKSTHRIPEPNAVAYQQGLDGIFFITTRYIRPGEELVVTYAPPYAKRCGLTLQTSEMASKSNFNKQPGRDDAANRVHPSPPDEIHCFRCTVTFNCEDAFRIHCLGHPDELVQRGILQPLTSLSTEPLATAAKSDNQNGDGYLKQPEQPSKNLSSICSDRILYCSLCSAEVNGLGSLIQHTDLMHSVLKPKIFKSSLAATISADCSLVLPEVNHIEDVDTVEPSVEIEKQSCLNPTDITGLPFTGLSESVSDGLGMDDDDILVVDLNHASQTLLERSLLWAYGCGGCSQRFPNLLALEQHKHHTCLRPSMLNSSGMPLTSVQLSSGSLTPPSKEHRLKQTKEVEPLNAPTCAALLPTLFGESPSFISQLQGTTLDDGRRELPSDSDYLTVSSGNLFESAFGETTETQSLQLDFECDICWARFRTRSAYSVHMRAHDCDTPRFPKNDNQLTSNSPTTECNPPQARRTTRTKARKCSKRGFFCCRVCSQRLNSQTAWRQHSLQHRRASDNRYPCPICCPEDISEKAQLGDNPRVYDTFDQLQRHMRNVHCNHIFPCPYCPCIFGKRKTLARHLSCHTGQRDFTCPQCGRSFARKDNLQRHRKTHTDVNV